MATPAQIHANHLNAQKSTGPRTPEGKSKSSRNALKLGLFSMDALVAPEHEAEYNELAHALWKDLAPEGALQQSLAAEIVNATWRLRRCARVEAGLLDSLLETGLDPMQNEAAIRVQNAVDRARAQSHNLIRRATAEIRRLQTDRQISRETLQHPVNEGVVAWQEIWTALRSKFGAARVAPSPSLEPSASEYNEFMQCVAVEREKRLPGASA